MNSAIVAIGSEMLTPQRLDTNSLFLTDQLNAIGVEVVQKLVVGDDRPRIVEALRYALASAELVLITGGLGPTEDDLTRDAVSEFTSRSLSLSEEACRAIEDRFRRFGRKMAPNNRRQALVLDGAEVMENPHGTAPGQWLDHDGAHIVLLPGPPRELEPMFIAQCIPRLARILPPLVIRSRCYRVAGMGESDLDHLISPIYKPYSNPATTILAALSDIQIYLRARCDTEAEAEALLAEVGDPIARALGDRMYSTNGEPLEAAVGRLLREHGSSVSVAESCTGGMVAERITSIPGSSDYFTGGFLTYTYAAKTSLLGVPAALLAEHGAVSEPVAVAMAVGARERTGSTFALSVTGVAGPAQGGEAEPVGTVFIGLATPEGCSTRRVQFGGDRDRIRQLAAQTALDLLRRQFLRD